jgi:hypothetical protein
MRLSIIWTNIASCDIRNRRATSWRTARRPSSTRPNRRQTNASCRCDNKWTSACVCCPTIAAAVAQRLPINQQLLGVSCVFACVHVANAAVSVFRDGTTRMPAAAPTKAARSDTGLGTTRSVPAINVPPTNDGGSIKSPRSGLHLAYVQLQ